MFARLWERLQPWLRFLLADEIQSRQFLSLRRRLETETEDLLQEVMLKAYRGMSGFQDRGRGSFRAWLAEILRNEVRNRVAFWMAERRSLAREAAASSPEELSYLKSALADPCPGPPDTLGEAERRGRVAQALASLQERTRQILFHRFYCGTAWREIAIHVGSPSADAVRIECANKALPALAAALAAALAVASPSQSATAVR